VRAPIAARLRRHLPERQPAVDDQGLPGDHGGSEAEEDDDLGKVFRLATSLQQGALDRAASLLVSQLQCPRSIDRARCDGVYPNLRRESPGEVLRQADDRGLRRAVGEAAAGGVDTRDRGDVDDRPASLLQGRGRGLGAAEDAEEIRLEHRGPEFLGNALQLGRIDPRARARRPGVVHQEIETTKTTRGVLSVSSRAS